MSSNNPVWISETNKGNAPVISPRVRQAPIRRKHIVTKHQPRLSDGIKHPVVVRKIGFAK